MANYQKLYTTLFNAITDAIGVLQKAQQDVEELYISADQPNLTVLEKPDAGSNSEGESKT